MEKILEDKDAINTPKVIFCRPTQKTGNGDGELHYLYKVNTTAFSRLPNSLTAIWNDGIGYTIDFKRIKTIVIVFQ